MEVVFYQDHFQFSVILPCDDSANRIQQTITSILNQSYSFKHNVQLVFLATSSNALSSTVKYKRLYPDNVIILSNNNLTLPELMDNFVVGKYCMWIRCGDCLEYDSIRLCQLFYEIHQDIDCACFRLHKDRMDKFDDIIDSHYSQTTVVNLLNRPDYTPLQFFNCFWRTRTIRQLIHNPQLQFTDQSLILPSLLLTSYRIAMLRECIYLIRNPSDPDHESVITQSDFETLQSYCVSVRGYIPDFLKNILFFRVQRSIFDGKPPQDISEYKKQIHMILMNIEDSIIMKCEGVGMRKKLYCLSLKYGCDIKERFYCRNGQVYYREYRIVSVDFMRRALKWETITITNNTLVLDGLYNSWLAPLPSSFTVTVSEAVFPIQYRKGFSNIQTLFETIEEPQYIHFELPLENIDKNLTFFYNCGNFTVPTVNSYGSHFSIPSSPFGFYSYGSYILEIDLCSIKVFRTSRFGLALHEFRYLWYLLSHNKLNCIYYRLSTILSDQKEKPIWLITDRLDRAGDNGEAFFNYMQKLRKQPVQVYFCILKKSPDYHRLEKIGSVVPYGSIKHKKLLLKSSVVISSQADDLIYNPFGMDKQYLSDLLRFSFVFLQHGVTKDDVSHYIHRFQANIKLLICVSKREKEAFSTPLYGYPESASIVTGFPRYDALLSSGNRSPISNHEAFKSILIIPTWRSNLCQRRRGYHSCIYQKTFKKSPFFQFYNSFISNPTVNQFMKAHGYVGTLCLHPNLIQQSKDFPKNTQFIIRNKMVDYQHELVKASLLITDYSSVAFDFAFLQKPIIYSQFDETEFFTTHTYRKGYFDYRRDGFGPVCTDLNCLINTTLFMLQNNCTLENIYQRRILSFFQYFDAHNSERVFTAIRKIPKIELYRLGLSRTLNIMVTCLGILVFALKVYDRIRTRPVRNKQRKE